jgi:hypothetical protein
VTGLGSISPLSDPGHEHRRKLRKRTCVERVSGIAPGVKLANTAMRRCLTLCGATVISLSTTYTSLHIHTSERNLGGSYEERVSAMSLVLRVLSSVHIKLGPA